MPSVYSLVASVNTVNTYFQFPIQSALIQYIGRQVASALRRPIGLIRNIGHRTLPKIWVGRPIPFLLQNVQPRGKTLN